MLVKVLLSSLCHSLQRLLGLAARAIAFVSWTACMAASALNMSHTRRVVPVIRCRSQEVVALAERMSKEVEVRDRQWRLKKYRSCFVGREAVRWMVRTAAVVPTEDDAVALGNAMLQLGLVAHVVRPNVLTQALLASSRMSCALTLHRCMLHRPAPQHQAWHHEHQFPVLASTPTHGSFWSSVHADVLLMMQQMLGCADLRAQVREPDFILSLPSGCGGLHAGGARA